MNKEDKLILGTLAGVDLVLSPEHYEEYKGTLNKQLEQKDKEIERLNEIIEKKNTYYDNLAVDYRIEHEEKNRLNNKLSELEDINEKIGLALDSAENKVDRLNNIINRIGNFVDRTAEIIKQQPSGNDEWILERLNGIKYLIELKEE